MLGQYKSRTNIGVGIGLVLQIAGRTISHDSVSGSSPIGTLVIIAGIAAFIWGCAQYSLGKGHSRWFGALGLLSILGLIVLVFLPDRHKQASA